MASLRNQWGSPKTRAPCIIHYGKLASVAMPATTPIHAILAVTFVAAVAQALRLRRRGPKALPQQKNCVYLDYAATCPIYPEVGDAMLPYLYSHWGNPSSSHAYGAPCRDAVTKARASVAALVNARSTEITFCSCGSEADNWAIVASLRDDRTHVVVSTIEHPAILACVDALETEGRCTVTRVGVDGRGLVDPVQVAAAVRPGKTALVSIMLANNEVGAVQPLQDIVARVKAVDPEVLVHTDAAQAVGKIDVDVATLQVDYLTLVGHKFGAPKGVAVLFHRENAPLPPLLYGGGQEGGRRAGTEAVPNLVALGVAADIWLAEGSWIAAHSAKQRDALRATLEAKLGASRCAVNGPLGAGDTNNALPNVLSFAVRGCVASSVLAAVKDEVAASASAACHSGTTAVSAVLRAVSVEQELAVGTLRLSVGRHTTDADVRRAADVLVRAILNP